MSHLDQSPVGGASVPRIINSVLTEFRLSLLFLSHSQTFAKAGISSSWS